MNKSLLDADFIGEDDAVPDKDEGLYMSEMTEVVKPPVEKTDAQILEVEIVDDTPDADKGRRVAPLDTAAPQNEDEEEIKSYSEKFQNRLKKETAKYHQERRAKEDLDRQLAAAADALKRVMNENNNLKNVVESGEKVLVGEHKTRLEGQLNAAKSAYREAVEAGDANGQIAAQEMVARAVAQLERLSGHRPQTLQRESFEDFEKNLRGTVQQPQPQVQEPSDKAKAWLERNAWFDNDVPMQSYALGFHKTLVDKGLSPESDEYFSAIDREMRTRFPDRFRGEAPRRQATTVAPVNRTNNAQPRKVTLTESQVRLARRLGLTAQQYAEQLVAESKNDGKDFTHLS